MPYYMPNEVYTFEGVTRLSEREWSRIASIAGIPPRASECSARDWEAYRLSTRGRPAPGWDAGGYRPVRRPQAPLEARQ